MKKLNRKVAIVGAAMSKFGINYPRLRSIDMWQEAWINAVKLTDKGISPKDIDELFLGNFTADLFNHQGHMAPQMADLVGLTPKPASRFEGACASSGIAFRQIMQSDFILFIRSCFDTINNETYRSWGWHPETLVYIERHSGTFEIFARAQSKEYFDRVKCIFDIEDKKDFMPLFGAFKENKLKIPHWHFISFNPEMLLGFEGLATRP